MRGSGPGRLFLVLNVGLSITWAGKLAKWFKFLPDWVVKKLFQAFV